MRALLVAAALCLCVAITGVASDRNEHLLKMFELKGTIEAIPRGADQHAVADLLRQLKLFYHPVARKDFRYDSRPSLVQPIPAEAESAYVGYAGGRPGFDDDFVDFVVLFDRDGKALAAKAKIFGYW